MRRMGKLLAGMALGMVMAVSFGGTAKAQTYLLSQILAEVHQGENYLSPFYFFEGGEEMSNPVKYPPTGKGPYFAPGDRIVSDLPGVYLLVTNPEMDNIRNVRALLESGVGYFTYKKRDGYVTEQIGDGAPASLSPIYNFAGEEWYTFTEGGERGLFQSMHIMSQEDEKAAHLLSELEWYGRGEEGTLPKSYRGESITEYYSADGEVVAYRFRLKARYDAEPNAQEYYKIKAAMRDPARIGDVFDAAYYAANNPDVAAVLGTDPGLLWQHYATAGYIEGRKAHPGNGTQELAQTAVTVPVPEKIYSEAEVMAIYEGALRAAGMRKPEEVYSAKRMKTFQPTDDMDCNIVGVSLKDPYPVTECSVGVARASGSNLYYIENLGVSGGCVKLKVYLWSA